MTKAGKTRAVLAVSVALALIGAGALAGAFVLQQRAGRSSTEPTSASAKIPASEAVAAALAAEREQLVAQKSQMEDRVKQLLSELAATKEKLASAEDILAVERKSTDPLRQELVRLKRMYEEVVLEIETMKKDNVKSSAADEAERKRRALEAADAAQQVNDMTKQISTLKVSEEKVKAVLAEREKEKVELLARINKLDAAITEARAEVAGLRETEAALMARCAELEAALGKARGPAAGGRDEL